MNRTKYVGIVVAAIVALALVWHFYPGADRDYQSAVQANTVEAYKHFVEAHPDDPRKQLALTRMDELTWALTQKSRSIHAIDDYIRRFPNGKFVTDATELKNDLALASLPVFEGHIGIVSEIGAPERAGIYILLTTDTGKYQVLTSEGTIYRGLKSTPRGYVYDTNKLFTVRGTLTAPPKGPHLGDSREISSTTGRWETVHTRFIDAKFDPAE
jgi:hypothetical protein